MNVVIAALEDKLLTESHEMLKKKYKKVEFRTVGVDLSATDPEVYMSKIRSVTDDVDVTLVFNNAGQLYFNLMVDLI